jgi:two-component system, cell cycle sensor histidine kinase and response regulator CckA
VNSASSPAIILLVDDDEALRTLVRRILMEKGFQVIEAADGEAALQIAGGYPQPIDLLLTDLIMPKVNGLVLAERLSRERPGIGVLYMSGYVEKAMLIAKHPESSFLQKPFTPTALIAAVRRTLASKEED